MICSGILPNDITFTSLISACIELGDFILGKTVLGWIVKLGFEENLPILNSLVKFFLQFGEVDSAWRIFYRMEERDMFSWTTMLAMYASMGDLVAARRIFEAMPERNEVTWSAMISSLNQSGNTEEAVSLFYKMVEYGFKPNVSCYSSVISALASLEALHAGYLEVQNYGEAFELLRRMIFSGEEANESAFSSVLSACANLASLEKGKYVHAKALKLGFHSDIFINTALVDMYAKSRSIECSRKIFNWMGMRNEIARTAMIQGLAENGFAEESLQLFEEMEQKTSSTVSPNALILLSVLFACSHCGLVEKGLSYFNSMESYYGVKPNERHYTCVADMLARSGRLHEAENFINSMPCELEVNAWAALLSGCRTYGNEALVDGITGKVWEGVESKPGGYVLLCNV